MDWYCKSGVNYFGSWIVKSYDISLSECRYSIPNHNSNQVQLLSFKLTFTVTMRVFMLLGNVVGGCIAGLELSYKNSRAV